MKKCILLIITVFSMIAFVACNKNNDNIIHSGTYIMQLEQEQNNNEIIAPFITLDSEQKSFLFSYNLLSSYLPIGTYEINDNILTATTDDEKYHYVFEIIDENTLSFLKESSSEITVIDASISIVPQNGTLFQKVEE